MSLPWVVRPVAPGDRGALLDLATALGPGMTTMPADAGALDLKIESSIASFAGESVGAERQYLLVLEDTEQAAILGTAAVYPSVGEPFGFFSYKQTRLVQHSKEFGQSVTFDLLHLANDFTGATEIGSLAVRPSLRGGGAGRLLARSRYMLMACFPELFADRVVAEMRGWQDIDGRSPFWEAVGARFFKMDFPTADRLSALNGSEFIADLLPKYPVYPDLLDESARKVIGVPHPASAPALAMLHEEGFQYAGLVDVFDAGPQVSAERGRIATIARSADFSIDAPNRHFAGRRALVATPQMDRFRVTSVELFDGLPAVEDAVRRKLGIDRGEVVRVSAGEERSAAPLAAVA